MYEGPEPAILAPFQGLPKTQSLLGGVPGPDPDSRNLLSLQNDQRVKVKGRLKMKKRRRKLRPGVAKLPLGGVPGPETDGRNQLPLRKDLRLKEEVRWVRRRKLHAGVPKIVVLPPVLKLPMAQQLLAGVRDHDLDGENLLFLQAGMLMKVKKLPRRRQALHLVLAELVVLATVLQPPTAQYLLAEVSVPDRNLRKRNVLLLQVDKLMKVELRRRRGPMPPRESAVLAPVLKVLNAQSLLERVRDPDPNHKSRDLLRLLQVDVPMKACRLPKAKRRPKPSLSPPPFVQVPALGAETCPRLLVGLVAQNNKNQLLQMVAIRMNNAMMTKKNKNRRPLALVPPPAGRSPLGNAVVRKMSA